MRETKGLSRRAFLKWSSALGGTAALASGCGLTSTSQAPVAPAATEPYPSDAIPVTTVQKDGWIPVACWADCGSRGYNRVFLKDGVVMHQGTDDTIPDGFWNPQLRGCQKGRMLRKRVFGLDRLKFPIKRKNFTPLSKGGPVNGHLRGKDEWVRISWEEALDTIANEMIRVKKEVGNHAIYSPRPGSYNGYTDVYRALTLFGGFVQDWGSQSSGTWGDQLFGLDLRFNDQRDFINSDLIILWGHNPSWSGTGLYTYMLTELRKKYGKKFISIDPMHNATAVVLGIKQEDWWPIRPVTDHALVLGLIHTLIVNDARDGKGSWLRWDYIDKYCFGFDKNNFKAIKNDAAANAYVKACDPAVNLRDYIMAEGKYKGGQVRDARWASNICGISPERIEELARLIAKTKNVAFTTAPAMSRQHDMDQWPQLVQTLAMITGHIGTTGNMCGSNNGHILFSRAPMIRGGSNCGRPTNFPDYDKLLPEYINTLNPVTGKYEDIKTIPNYSAGIGAGGSGMRNTLWDIIRINRNEMWQAFAEKQYHPHVKDAGDPYNKPKPLDVRLLWLAKGERVNQNPDALSARRAFRSMEFVGAMDQYLTPQCQYSDIVLPATSLWEKTANIQVGHPENMILARKVIEPVFEAKDDVWVARELALRLQKVDPRVDPMLVQPCSPDEDIFEQLTKVEVLSEKGQWEKLITIEADDAKRYNADKKFGTYEQTGKIRLKDFEQKGIYHLKRSEGDAHNFIPNSAFIAGNGKSNPLPTVTGKFEIHCKSFSDLMYQIGYSNDSSDYSKAYTPIPEYRAITEGYEWTFQNRDITKPKGKLPLQYMTLHVQRRAHSSYENTPGLWDIFTHPLYMNPIDAEERGLKENDAVLIQGETGGTIRNVHITHLIRPGAVAMGQGAWVDLDDEEGIDRAGSTNALFSTRRLTGQGQMHLQSTPVEVSKWTKYPVPAKKLIIPVQD